MPIIRRDFDTVEGLNVLTSAFIYNVNLLSVEREGTGQVPVSISGAAPTLGSRQYNHTGSTLTFAADLPFLAGEKITIIYLI